MGVACCVRLLLLQMGLVDEDMHIVQLLLGNRGGGVHHQVLGVLVHGEGDDLADGFLAGQHHDQAEIGRAHV